MTSIKILARSGWCFALCFYYFLVGVGVGGIYNITCILLWHQIDISWRNTFFPMTCRFCFLKKKRWLVVLFFRERSHENNKIRDPDCGHQDDVFSPYWNEYISKQSPQECASRPTRSYWAWYHEWDAIVVFGSTFLCFWASLGRLCLHPFLHLSHAKCISPFLFFFFFFLKFKLYLC